MPRFDQLMIDTETLGTGADSVILSIGAVKFSRDGKIADDGFYASCSIDSQRDRRISESTLIWWLTNPKVTAEARAVFAEPKVTLESALIDFVKWVDHSQYNVWSNGADFDIPLIKHALEQHGLTPPWEFWNQRCFRTTKSEAPGMSVAAPKSAGTAHNAMVDALAQVNHLQAIWAAQKPGAKTKEKSLVKQS